MDITGVIVQQVVMARCPIRGEGWQTIDPAGELVAPLWKCDPEIEGYRDARSGQTYSSWMSNASAHYQAQVVAAAVARANWRARRIAMYKLQNGGFFGSFKGSLYSMGLTYKGIWQGGVSGTGESVATLQDAYDVGIFGQTDNADPVIKWGTRGAVGVATATGVTASGLMIAGVGGGLATLNSAAAAGWAWLTGTGTAATAVSQSPQGQATLNEIESGPVGGFTEAILREASGKLGGDGAAISGTGYQGLAQQSSQILDFMAGIRANMNAGYIEPARGELILRGLQQAQDNLIGFGPGGIIPPPGGIIPPP